MTNVVHASPTKRFFVEMLTRDIELDDAILNLLDNSLDGVLESLGPSGARGVRPYEDYWVNIELSPTAFRIFDNCGGIGKRLAIEYAFMLGRPAESSDRLPTVGMYGIGMKRAIFKMGRQATVTSTTTKEAFKVPISAHWLEDDHNWDLPLLSAAKADEAGTDIRVASLLPNVKDAFSEADSFVDDLKLKIATHYEFILHKGFRVSVNGEEIQPKPLLLLTATDLNQKKAIEPYVWRGKRNGVSIEVVVGFYRVPPSDDEIEADTATGHSRDNAGWSVVCNDRVVVHRDKSRLTGWGEAGVPSFHSQFNSIAGVVRFTCADEQHKFNLPITTTKRGVDAASEIFSVAKDFMREGTKYFTNYTNRWKGRNQEERASAQRAKAVPLAEITGALAGRKAILTRGDRAGQKYVPNLPTPKDESNHRVMRFSRPEPQIRRVAKHLFDDPDYAPSEVAGACFDQVLKGAK